MLLLNTKKKRKMEKIYTTPAMQETEMDLRQAVAQASGVRGENPEIGYGGVDRQGTKDPDANHRNDRNAEWGNLW